MKKLLMVLLLSLTTIFTQVNAQTQEYNVIYVDNELYEGDDGSITQNASNWMRTEKIEIINDSIIIATDRYTSILFWDQNDNYIGHYASFFDPLGPVPGAGDISNLIPNNAYYFALNAANYNSGAVNPSDVTTTQFQNNTISYSAPFSYPADINLDSNYGDYFDADIQFQDQDELYQDYPINAQSADVNDNWQATAPTSNIGSFSFQHWYDLDNDEIYSTNSFIEIIGPDRDYNLRAIYAGVTEYQVDLEMEAGVSGSIQYQGNSFENNSIGQVSAYVRQTVPDGTAWIATAPNVAGQTFDEWYNLDTNTTFSTNSQISISSTSQDYDLEARYSPTPTYSFDAVSDLPSPPDFQYQVNSETVQFDYPVNLNLDQGDDIQITAPTSNIGFYEFDGWYDISGTPILETSQSTLSISNVQENNSFEARYILPEEYQINLTLTSQIGDIQFQVDSETPIFAPEIDETLFSGQSFQATAPSPPSNFEFQNWYDLDTNEVFNLNRAISEQDVDRDYILEARYLEIFDLTFDSAGGTAVPDDTALDGEEYNLPEPTREDFIFLGWFDKTDPLAVVVNDPFTITEDVDFEAVWLPIITVDFNSNGGSPVDSQSVSQGGVITEPAIPTRFGYQFDGWYTDNNTFANEYDFTQSVDVFGTDFTLHAKWEIGSDSDVNQTLSDWINNSGMPTMVIIIIIMLSVTVTLGVINAQMYVILITDISLLFIFASLGFIPLWILLVAGLAVLGFTIMLLFGGRDA